jgi:uncharacterized protein (DUF885 family)
MKATGTETASARDDLAAIAQEWWEFGLDESPVSCTALGLERGADRLDERGPSARERRERAVAGFLRRLAAVPTAPLSEEERITHAVLLRAASEEAEAARHRAWEWDLNQLTGLHLEIQDAVTRQPLAEPRLGAAYLARLAAVPEVVAQHVGDLRDGLASGRVAPKTSYDRVVAQLREFVALPAAATSFAQVVDRLPGGWTESDAAALRRAVADAIEASVRPAYVAYLRFLETEYAGRARPEVGVASIPGGADAYAFFVRRHTTTALSPRRIHEIGLEELAANEAEMLEIARGEGWKGDLRGYLDDIGRSPKYRLASREALLARYREICARMDARLPEVFGILPSRPYEVRALEEWREKDAPGAYYYPPAVEGGRPGIFYANTHDPSSWPTYDMETLSFHEAVPGHHLQIAIAQDLTSLPLARRHGGFTAYVEGWAHYAERLADEMGMYSTPVDRVGMLAGQAWRAARLVVDTGMHALGWPREKAVATMARIRSGPESDVANEVDRYVVWPGQALAYKIGQRTIAEARAKAKARLGARFALRGFHDEVLRHGALPLSVFDDVLAAWEPDPR